MVQGFELTLQILFFNMRLIILRNFLLASRLVKAIFELNLYLLSWVIKFYILNIKIFHN